MPKYVASTTLKEPLSWSNSTLLNGDVPKAVAHLKEQTTKNLVVMGSGELVQTLMQRNLVDRYVLADPPAGVGSRATTLPGWRDTRHAPARRCQTDGQGRGGRHL